MSASEILTSKGFLTVGTVVLLGAVGVWAYTGYTGEPKSTLPKELQVEALKQNVEDPGKMFDKMREVRNREDLSEEQQRELRDNFRTVFEERMNQQMDQYFTAAPEAQVDLLDEQIDRFTEQAGDWEKRREEWQKEREAREKERAKNGETREGESEEDRRESWRNRAANMDRGERKERSETRDPDQMGRRMAYFSALQKRAAERGVQMPSFGRGGRDAGSGRGGPGGGGSRGGGPSGGRGR
jgi:uncharacterized membrane protein YgcG